MDFSDYLYIIAAFVFVTFLYMFCHSRRMDLERRISLGRIQVTRILADNGRRLSQIGLQIERKFSDSGNMLDPREIASEVRRRSTLENITDSERKKRDRQMKQADSERKPWKSTSTGSGATEYPSTDHTGITPDDNTARQVKANPIKSVNWKGDDDAINENPRGVEDIPDENRDDKEADQHHCRNTGDQHKQSISEPLRESPVLVKYISNGPYNTASGNRRDSVMPVFSTPKSLPRRKSFLPVLNEELATARRPSVSQITSTHLQAVSTPKKHVVLVKPPAYVCPRRSSVLFSSTLFAHVPGRRLSKVGRDEPINAEDHPSNGNLAPKHPGRQDSNEEHDELSNTCVWQSSIGSRARRKSSTGTVYKPRRGSITAMSRDVSISEASDTHVSALSFFGRRSNQERRQSIPKLKGNYLTGNLTEFKTIFGPNAHEELTAKRHRYGPLYQINALGQKIVFLFDHKDIDALKKAEGKCPKHMDFKHLRIYRQRNNLPLGVLLSCGDDWKRQRKILSKAMNSTVVQIQYIPVINQVAREVVDVIHNKLNEEPFSEIYMPEGDVNNYAIEAFGRVLYGRDLNCLSSNRDTDLHKFVEIAKSNFEDAKALMTLPSCLMLLHPAWRRHNEKWNFLLETTIKQALLSIHSDKKNPCVLSHLINNGEMTESEMLVNLTDLLHASIDTTSTAIHWCLYELGKHPQSVKHIVDDYRHYVGDGVDVTMEHLQNLTYLKAVVKETLRLHPVGFLASRTISRQMSVREYKVQPQANVAACMYVMGRNKQLVQDPEMFVPGRWLKDNQELDRFYKDVPFGFGARMCIGKRIAEIEIALFLLHFCLNFEFRLSPTCHIEHTVKLLLVPSRPLELYIKARKDQQKGDE